MDVIITNQPEKVAADIIETFVRDNATLGLATGSTPLPTYRELIRRHEEKNLSFAQCQAFLLDEYIGLPITHEQSYYRTIRREFTSRIDIPDAKVHSPNGMALDSVAAGHDYDAAIKAAGGVDIQILGVGTDGHIAFNEPGSAFASRTRPTSLHPQTVKDNSRFFEGDEAKVPRRVLTQGLATIMEARHLVLIATGSGKKEAVAALVDGPVDTACPASVLQRHPHATVIVDEAAAALLSKK